MLRDSDDLDTPIVMRMSDNPSIDFDFVAKLLSKCDVATLLLVGCFPYLRLCLNCVFLVVGDSAVGKSQLFNMFADETFSEEHRPTLLVEYRHRFIDTLKSRCKIQIWDCLSSSSAAIMTSIYKGAHGVVLLYDVNNRDTLDSAPEWLAEIQQYSTKNIVVYLVGTKTDLPNRLVSIEQGQAMAARLGIKYFEVSSKTGENVDSLFCKIINDLKDINALSIAASSRAASTAPTLSRQDPYLLAGEDDSARQSSSSVRAGNDSSTRKCCIIL